MTHFIEHTRTVPYTPEQMFRVVNEVAHYPEFVPHCRAVTVTESTPTRIVAELTVGKGWVQQSFTTENTVHYPHRIDMRLVRGPFSHLEGGWQFHPTTEGCRLQLALRIGFDRLSLQLVLKPLMEKLAEEMMNSFQERARKLYG